MIMYKNEMCQNSLQYAVFYKINASLTYLIYYLHPGLGKWDVCEISVFSFSF